MNNDLATLFGGNPFDPSTVEPQSDFPVKPPNKYPVLIEKAEVRLTKKETGHYIYLEEKILEGPYAGQKFFDQINVDNPSAQCVEIGLRMLSALGRAIGLTSITDTAQLINQVVIAHVKVKGDQNVIRTYSSAAQPLEAPGNDPTPPITPAPVQQAGVPQVTHFEPAPTSQTPPTVGGTTTAPASPREITPGLPPWMK